MLNLKNKLAIQDLLIELERNILDYEVKIHKTIENGEVTFLEIRMEGKLNDKINN